jgi:hypothetical protein
MIRRMRFGLLSVFAAMLLAVSAGGWAKFHWDLHQEEQAVLAALAEAGCDVHVRRELPPEEASATPPTTSEPAFWDEYLFRIRVLAVTGDASPELRRRIAELPELEQLQIYERSEGKPPGVGPALPPPEKILGKATPQFERSRLDLAMADEPHPEGTKLSDQELAELVAEIREAWTERPTPGRFARIEEYDVFGWGLLRVVHARDGEAYLVCEDQEPAHLRGPMRPQLHFADGESSHSLEPIEEGWRVLGRISAEIPDRLHYRPPSPDGYVNPKFAFDPAELDHVASAQRLEGGRIRLLFEPYVRRLPDVPGTTIPVEEQSLILDGGLDWSPVSLREINRSRPVSCEYRFERIGGYVLPVEAVQSGSRTRVAWAIEPEFDPGTFSLEGYFDPPVPARRDLPFWRWYRVTFAVSLALFALLIGRSAASFFGERSRATEQAGTTPGS